MKDDFEVLWVARYDYPANWHLKPHIHNFFQVIGIIDGQGEFILKDSIHTIEPKQLYLITPNVQHGLMNTSGYPIKTLDIKFYINDTEIKSLLEQNNTDLFNLDTALINILEAIRHEGLAKKPFFNILANTYLKQMVYLLLRQSDSRQQGENDSLSTKSGIHSNSHFINKLLVFFEYNFHKKLTLEQVASHMGYDKHYLCEMFKKEIGDTPISFLYKFRIQKAKELILYSDYSLKEISGLTGFESIHHFSRIFKNITSMSPGQWRNKERDGIRKDIYINKDFDKL